MGCLASAPDAPGFHGCYILGEVVGTGSFAQTRRVARVTDGAEALAKIVDLRTNESHMLEAQNETDVWRRVGNHVHVVKLADVFEDRSFYYMVMELCEQGFMQRLKSMTQACEWNLAPILYEVLHALAHVHAAHVIHGDVKPNNFFFKSGIVKLSDFGLSARYVPGDDDRPKGQVGFVAYMSPEMLQDAPYDFQTDVWSAGVIAYLLMYGELPYNAKQHGSWIMQQRFSTTSSMGRSSNLGKLLKPPKSSLKEKEALSPTPSEGTSFSGTSSFASKSNTREMLKAAIKDGRCPPRYQPFDEDADMEDQARRPPLTAASEAFLQSLLTRDPEKRPSARDALQLDFLAKPPPGGALSAAACLRPAIAQAAALVKKQAASTKQTASWRSAAKLLMEKQRKAGHQPDFRVPASPASTADGEARSLLDDEVPTSPPPPAPCLSDAVAACDEELGPATAAERSADVDDGQDAKVGGEPQFPGPLPRAGSAAASLSRDGGGSLPTLLMPQADDAPVPTNLSRSFDGAGDQTDGAKLRAPLLEHARASALWNKSLSFSQRSEKALAADVSVDPPKIFA